MLHALADMANKWPWCRVNLPEAPIPLHSIMTQWRDTQLTTNCISVIVYVCMYMEAISICVLILAF